MIYCVQKFFQNLLFKINFFFTIMLFKVSSQILAALLSKCYREQLVGLWLGVKRFFTSVRLVFVSQLVQSFWFLRPL